MLIHQMSLLHLSNSLAEYGFYKTIFSQMQLLIVSRYVRNFIEKSHANQAVCCSLSHSVFCSRSISGLM